MPVLGPRSVRSCRNRAPETAVRGLHTGSLAHTASGSGIAGGKKGATSRPSWFCISVIVVGMAHSGPSSIAFAKLASAFASFPIAW